MISLALFVYAAALTMLARNLAGQRWVTGAPRLAIVMWQSLTASAVAAVIGGCLALMIPSVHLSADIAEWLQACVVALRARYDTPAGTAAGIAGGLLAAAVLARVAAAVLVTLVASTRWRRHHVAGLTMLSEPASAADACVLADDVPLVYCLPGAQRGIVLTTGALGRLTALELEAVLAHERGHLRQRHHLLVAWTGSLRRAFPRMMLFRVAHREVERLVELLADDAAIRTSDRLDLASALLNLGNTPSPQFGLGVADTASAQRVRRLIDPPPRLGRVRAFVLYSVAALLAVAPVVTLAGPAFAIGNATFCPVHLSGSPSAISRGGGALYGHRLSPRPRRGEGRP
jgi:Zn-dependent protease with chaperone function